MSVHLYCVALVITSSGCLSQVCLTTTELMWILWRLPVIHRSLAALRSFQPFSSDRASSSPQCLFGLRRCHRRCRSSPHPPSSSSCAYGTLEITHGTGNSHFNISRLWFLLPFFESSTPASWRSSPLASSIRQASRQHWIAASFFFPVCVTSATSCRPRASSTGNLTERST